MESAESPCFSPPQTLESLMAGCWGLSLTVPNVHQEALASSYLSILWTWFIQMKKCLWKFVGLLALQFTKPQLLPLCHLLALGVELGPEEGAWSCQQGLSSLPQHRHSQCPAGLTGGLSQFIPRC